MRYIRFKKLEQFCLHVIVENLEKFIYSKNVPQKHIDFLLRVYSEEIFKKFSHREQVSEDCMLWFLNPHSKKVQLTTVSEKITSQLQIVGSTITSLTLKNSLASESMIDAIISCVPNVVHLDLSKSLCTDTNMLCIQRMCPVLSSLDLTECEITCDGMSNLCGMHQPLRKLNLTGTDAEPCGIYDILKGFPLLQELKCYSMAEMFYDIHREDLMTNAYKNIQYNLTELICDTTENILEILHVWIILCPYVTRIYLECCPTQKVLEMCSRFKYLEFLEVKKTESHMFMDEHEWYGDGWHDDRNSGTINVLDPFIPKGSRLTKLALTGFEISIKSLMGCFENLKTLCLEKVTFTEYLEDELALKENKLDVLVLKDIPLDVSITFQAILALISVSSNVTTLHVSYNKKLSQNICDAILNSMKNLSFVNIFGIMTLENLPSLHRFFQIRSLETYIFEGWSVAELGLKFDCSFPSTPRSTLSWCQWNYDSDYSDDGSCQAEVIKFQLDNLHHQMLIFRRDSSIDNMIMQ